MKAHVSVVCQYNPYTERTAFATAGMVRNTLNESLHHADRFRRAAVGDRILQLPKRSRMKGSARCSLPSSRDRTPQKDAARQRWKAAATRGARKNFWRAFKRTKIACGLTSEDISQARIVLGLYRAGGHSEGVDN